MITARVLGIAAAASLVGAALLPTSASAAPATGTLTGHLVTTSGAPATGIEVVASGDLDRHPGHVYRASTDAAGEYAFTGVAPDGYDVGIVPNNVWATRLVGSAKVTAGATATVPTVTVVRTATVTGVLVSAVDGSPIAGAHVYTVRRSGGSLSVGNGDGTTAADGSFTLHASPDDSRFDAMVDGWFDVRKPLTLNEGEEVALGRVAAQPSGIVTATVRGLDGKRIRTDRVEVDVDRCRLDLLDDDRCAGAQYAVGLSTLQLSPGTHMVRFSVSNPVSEIVRHVSRTVAVRQATTVDLGALRVKADPMRRLAVREDLYAKGRPVTVVVTPADYTDGRTPHLAVTFVVNGRAVKAMSEHYRRSTGGTRLRLVATLPVSWSTRTVLRVRAVAHGTAAYAGQTSPTAELLQAR